MTLPNPEDFQPSSAFSSARPTMILLVDDQPMIAEAIRRQLAGTSGMHFHYCANPLEAMALIERIKPSCILLDLVMPQVDGLDLLAQIRDTESTQNLPVLMLSTTEDPVTKAKAFSLGANDYLIKLPDQVEMVARLQYHSNAYLVSLERDDAFRALEESQRKLEIANLELLRLSRVDGLTGLANRRYFDEYLAHAMSNSARSGFAFSLIMLDVDFFKRFNDHYGHLAGDDCLRQVGAVLSTTLKRTTDMAFRYGGEEFAVVLNHTDEAGTQTVAEALRAAIEALDIPHAGSDAAPHVSVSLGWCNCAAGKRRNAEAVIQAADQALYHAKKAGRNRTSQGRLPLDTEEKTES